MSTIGGFPDATIIGGEFKSTVENSALSLGTFAHASELEDDRFPGPIGTYWIFPVFFSLGEYLLRGEIGLDSFNDQIKLTDPNLKAAQVKVKLTDLDRKNKGSCFPDVRFELGRLPKQGYFQEIAFEHGGYIPG